MITSVNQEESARYFEALGLNANAPLSEIEDSYQSLKKKHSKDKEKLQNLEEAYKFLTGEGRQEPGPDEASFTMDAKMDAQMDAQSEPSDPNIYSGPVLRRIREEKKIELDDIAGATKIQVKTLMHIEEERYAPLPPEVYVRGFIKNYARYLSIDPEKAASDYMQRYEDWKEGKDNTQNRHFRFSRKKGSK